MFTLLTLGRLLGVCGLVTDAQGGEEGSHQPQPGLPPDSSGEREWRGQRNSGRGRELQRREERERERERERDEKNHKKERGEEERNLVLCCILTSGNPFYLML